MDAMNSLLKKVKADYPAISFTQAEDFRWSAEQATIYYSSVVDHAEWTLLHELGHMLHGHQGYQSDNALVHMEVEAWAKAQELAAHYNIEIDEDYIQDCLDSYRGWHHERSKCPTCTQTGLEISRGNYRCINCASTWQVTPNRFCRVYRKQKSPA